MHIYVCVCVCTMHTLMNELETEKEPCLHETTHADTISGRYVKRRILTMIES